MKTKSSAHLSISSVGSLTATEYQANQLHGARSDHSRSYIVPMVARAIHITQTLQNENGCLTLDDLLKVTGYSRTTVYRILRTLVSFGYVRREVRYGKYGWCASPERDEQQKEKREPYPSW
jgi:uncharacterized membrane protein